MANISRTYRINKKGKMVKSRSHTALFVAAVVIALIVFWIVFVVFFSRYAANYLAPYTTAENEYETASTLLNITASLWGSLIGGIATGSIAFLSLWLEVRRNKLSDKIDRCQSISPELVVEIVYRNSDNHFNEALDEDSADNEKSDAEEHYEEDVKQFIRLTPEISKEAVEYFTAYDEFAEELKKLDDPVHRQEIRENERILLNRIKEDVESLKTSGGKKGSKLKEKEMPISSRTVTLPSRNCAGTAQALSYDRKKDYHLSMQIHNEGCGRAQVDSLICSVSGQPWAFKHYVYTGSNENPLSVELIVERIYSRRIRFCLEFTDTLGIRFIQKFF